MKILFNTYPTAFNTPGGGEQQLLDYKKHLEEYNVDIEFYNQWKTLGKDYSIIHFFSTMSGSLVTLDYLKKNLNIPLVVSPNFWVDVENWKKSGTYEEIKTILWLADTIIVNSYIEEEYLVRNMQIDSSKIGIVHNMYNEVFLNTIDESLFRDKYGITGKFILNVANVEPRKNQLAFLKALKEFPEYKLIIIGSTRESWYYDACIQEAGEQFLFLGRIDNSDPLLRSAYSGCEFFAMPSLVETPSISALEAAVSGAKILITDLGSTKEYFKDMVEYVNPYDVEMMKNAISRIINQEKNNNLSEFIINNFSYKNAMKQLTNIYINLSNEKTKKSIHQFHSGSAYGDAVTNGMLFTKKLLIELGFHSKIYAEHVAPEYENEIEHFSKYKSNENNILLLHHSMGHDQDKWIESLVDQVILVYHNITPEYFFEKGSLFYNYSLKGRKQLDLLKKKSIASIGDSILNTQELI